MRELRLRFDDKYPQITAAFLVLVRVMRVDRLLRPTKERSPKSHELTLTIDSNPSFEKVSAVGRYSRTVPWVGFSFFVQSLCG
jgi:hypothetical protein